MMMMTKGVCLVEVRALEGAHIRSGGRRGERRSSGHMGKEGVMRAAGWIRSLIK